MVEKMKAIELPAETFEPAETMDIRGLDTLKVMADSRRMQIVDLLRRQAATVKGIAASLGVPPKSLYYHVKLLERHGLILVVDTRLVSGILERRYRAAAYLFNFREIDVSPGSTPQQGALEAVSSLFDITRDEIRIALESGVIEPGEDAAVTAALSIDWALCNLTPEARKELWERVDALFQEYHVDAPPSANEQPYRLLCAMFPTFRRGVRPGATSELVTGDRS
jgi:DNA-binding transcriptional ArsR family regulator